MRLCAGWRLNNLAYLILLACNLPPKGTLAVAADFAAEIGSRFESNASNSDKPSDRLADGFLTAHVDAGTNGVWGRDWRWRASLSGEGEEAFRFTGLSQIEGGVRLGVDRKFGLGWNAPRLQFDLYSAFRGAGQPGASGFRLASVACPCLADRGKRGSKRSLHASVVFRTRRIVRLGSPRGADFRLVRPFSRDPFVC